MGTQRTILSQDRPLRTQPLTFSRVKRERLSPPSPGIVSKWIGPVASGMSCAAALAWDPFTSPGNSALAGRHSEGCRERHARKMGHSSLPKQVHYIQMLVQDEEEIHALIYQGWT